MNRGSCVDCEEQDAVIIDNYKDELCSTCYTKRRKENWRKACKYDNIEIDSKFVVFSDNNPYQNYK